MTQVSVANGAALRLSLLAAGLSHMRNAASSMCLVSSKSLHQLVMPGLVPGIHVLFCRSEDVDGRDKPGHDTVEDLLDHPRLSVRKRGKAKDSIT
ncbi:hypothetical protein [Bradyrhizobium sp. USDA 4486]